MRSGTGQQGYTILETMIFLAVSGMMFVIAALFISGKQASAGFKQGVNSINSQVQDVIDDVGNGYFPAETDFSCSAGVDGPVFGPSHSQQVQGSNDGCVFIGKVIQFNVANPSYPNGDSTAYNVYTLAGLQYASGSPPAGSQASIIAQVPSSLAEANPKVIYDPAGNVDLTSKDQLEGGLSVISVKDLNTGEDVAGIGFFNGLGTYSNGYLSSGPSSVFEANVDGLSDYTESRMITQINGAFASDDSSQPTSTNIQVCFLGPNNDYATLTIGNSTGQGLTTNTKIYSSRPSTC